MFRSKSLLCCKKAAVLGSNLATKPSKSSLVNAARVINFNKENRHLFGKLLDKQTRHRKPATEQERARSFVKDGGDEETKRLSIEPVGTEEVEINRLILSEIKKEALNSQTDGVITDITKLQNVQGIEPGASLEATKLKIDKTNRVSLKKVPIKTPPSTNADRTVKAEDKIQSKVYNNGNDTDTLNQDTLEQYESTVKSVFPLINAAKCSLSYGDCIKHIINISYENVDRDEYTDIPSVGEVLRATMPASTRFALERWKRNMIAQLGEEGFEKLNKANLKRGVKFHDCIRKYMLGESINEDELPDNVRFYFKSLNKLLPHLKNVAVVESHVVHPELSYRGFIDCVAEYKGTPVIIEWKLTEKPKPYLSSTYDAPLQMTAYLGALNYDKNYKIPVQSGLVVAAYTDGSPADVFFLPEKECQKHWEKFYNRLQSYRQEASGKE